MSSGHVIIYTNRIIHTIEFIVCAYSSGPIYSNYGVAVISHIAITKWATICNMHYPFKYQVYVYAYIYIHEDASSVNLMRPGFVANDSPAVELIAHIWLCVSAICVQANVAHHGPNSSYFMLIQLLQFMCLCVPSDASTFNQRIVCSNRRRHRRSQFVAIRLICQSVPLSNILTLLFFYHSISSPCLRTCHHWPITYDLVSIWFTKL